MPINTIQKYVTNLQKKLDDQVVKGATSGWMEANAGQVEYTGGKYVEIPVMSTDGLANYDRDKGYVQGGIKLNYERHEMGQDRGRSFLIDRMDNDETAFLLSVANAFKAFQQDHVIPEIDAYRYSKLATLAIAAGRTTTGYTPTVADIFSKLIDDLGVIEDVYGEEADIVISMPGSVKRILQMSSEWQRHASIVELGAGDLKTKLQAVNGHPIIVVPEARMKTKYIFQDGTTGGQEAGGFKADGSALTINWLLTVRRAPIAINKTDKFRVFDPNTYQQADAWKFDYRKYHELWVKDSQKKGIFVNTRA